MLETTQGALAARLRDNSTQRTGREVQAPATRLMRQAQAPAAPAAGAHADQDLDFSRPGAVDEFMQTLHSTPEAQEVPGGHALDADRVAELLSGLDDLE
jgi:hypothetical protein